MQRYILNEETKKFYKEDLHHIKNVMRMKDNDLIEVCLNNKCYIASLIIGDDISYEIKEPLVNDKTLNITLIQGSLKGSKIESTIKYATIFGAKQIIITEFERSISKLKNADNKFKRYFSIAKEAAELSKREMIPNINIVEKLKQINFKEFDYIILADEEEKENSLEHVKLENLNEETKIAVLIGPEGGISNNDRNHLINEGSYKITLGNYIYPAEIAHISILNQLSLKKF